MYPINLNCLLYSCGVIMFNNYYCTCTCSFVPTEVVLRSPGARMDEVAIDVYCGMDSTVFITEMGRVFACGK